MIETVKKIEVVFFKKILAIGAGLLFGQVLMAAPAAPGSEAYVLREIHLTNLLEIKAGSLAKEKGSTKGVRNGQRLVEDHSKADKKTKKTAENIQADIVTPIPALDEKMQGREKDILGKLQPLSGAEFDKVFAKEMESAHEHTIKQLNEAKNSLVGTKTAALIAELLPTLHQHEKIAAKLD